MKSSQRKGTILLCVGFVFIIVGMLTVVLASQPTITNNNFLIQPFGIFRNMNATMLWAWTHYVSYPYLLLSMIPFIFGVLLIIVGVFVMIVPHSREHYYGD